METSKGLDYVRGNSRAVILTTRASGAPALAPVTVGVVDDQIVMSTRETAYKVGHLRRQPETSLCVFPDKWLGRWVQLNCRAEVISLPDAMETLVEYYRTLSGEHPDWDDYRRAMTEDQRCIIRFEILSAGPDVMG
ncbi:MAG: PPOX class F420-dependent oxidoreductase [Actinomycetia bacterium]|nr:PPOX class F420-dependent oxidoreductase [Actinomycetes bacterium]MCP4958397.1 PPOX class F420-dependent oxidoreductase [Actinomycetes bacterium]